jgi:hypothetical protein
MNGVLPLPGRRSIKAEQSDVEFATEKPKGEVVDLPLCDHYRLIGEMLSHCEAANAKVGIPFLFPTPRVAESARQVGPSLDDFVRASLVGVPTRVLESYCDDLENLTEEAKPAQNLFIREPTMLERFGFLCAMTAILGILSFIGVLACGESAAVAGRSALLVLTALSLLVIVVTSETYRRTTLSWVMVGEILRRRGNDFPASRGIPIDLPRTSFSGDMHG